jgi:uncharacterized protein YcbX
MAAIVVSSLHVYPLKSASAIALDRAQVGDRGFVGDRRWMLVDDSDEFITQRSHPELARIRTSIDSDSLRFEHGSSAALVVPRALESGPKMHVEVWSSTCDALAAPDKARRWFSDYLGTDCTLVYMPDSTRRAVDSEPADIVSFADAYPFLLIEQASLDDLNRRLETPVPMDRFRPNIVVSGAEAFAADDWTRVRIGEVEFEVAEPCARCVVTTVDQASGDKGGERGEPLRTLSEYRREGTKVMFGQNLIHRSRGVVRVGDAVELIG